MCQNIRIYIENVIYFQISGSIANTGHSVIFTADNDTSIYSSYGNSNSGGMQINNQIPVNLTGKFSKFKLE